MIKTIPNKDLDSLGLKHISFLSSDNSDIKFSNYD